MEKHEQRRGECELREMGKLNVYMVVVCVQFDSERKRGLVEDEEGRR